MFVQFESSDAKKRDAVRDRRLMLLRCAYLNGYFDERETEPMPEIIADGVGSERPTEQLRGPVETAALNEVRWPELENSIEKLANWQRQLEAYRQAFNCYPKSRTTEEILADERLETERDAIESVCPGCAGHGDRRGQDGENLGECYICLGTGIDPRRPQKCPHLDTFHWPSGNTICTDCGEIIGRGEIT